LAVPLRIPDVPWFWLITASHITCPMWSWLGRGSAPSEIARFLAVMLTVNSWVISLEMHLFCQGHTNEFHGYWKQQNWQKDLLFKKVPILSKDIALPCEIRTSTRFVQAKEVWI
jgi:hypothetical protein